MSVGLSTSEAEILGTLVPPIAEHTLGSRAEYGQPVGCSNIESQLVLSAGGAGIFSTASAPLALCLVEILETRVA